MPHKSAREPAGSMDSRGARGGETETVDRRGQDHARYAKVTSDVKKGYKRGGERAGRGKRRRGRRDGGERGLEGARGGERGARG